MPCCKISDCAQMSKTIIAVRHFGLGGRESLETAVIVFNLLFRFIFVFGPCCVQKNTSAMIQNSVQ